MAEPSSDFNVADIRDADFDWCDGGWMNEGQDFPKAG
jgi:hypothetical protein